MYIKKLLVGSLPSHCFRDERNVTSELIEKKYLRQEDIEISASVNKAIYRTWFWGLLIDCIRRYSDI